MTANSRHQSAFTLLEVLVALIIISVGLTATIISSIEIMRNSSHLRNKTLAHWVAANIIAERKLDTRHPSALNNSGNTTMADQTWQWEVQISNTDINRIQRIEVIVKNNDNVYSSLISYEYLPENLR